MKIKLTEEQYRLLEQYISDNIEEGRVKSERTDSGKKVPGKYLTKNKSAMKKEIEKYSNSDEYKTKWDADYKSGKGGKGDRYETKKSDATKAYEKMFGEGVVKDYVSKKQEDFKKSWKSFVFNAKKEGKETVEATKIIGKLLSKKEVTKDEIKFVKEQSLDLAKIVSLMAMGAVSMAIPIALEKILKKYGISIMPKEHTRKEDEVEVDVEPENSEILDETADSIEKALSNKSKDSGIPKGILKKVYNKGMAAWNKGHKPGTPQNAWAMGRVNSFITGKGGSRKADSELWSSAKKHLSEQTDYINYDRMLITESKTIMSEGLKYHVNNQIPLHETIYRYGSESFFRLINEVRNLENQGKIDLCDIDKEIIKTDIGKKGIYEGNEVWLDIPFEEDYLINEAEYHGRTVKLGKPKRGGSKKFFVYTMCDGKVKKVSFGAKSGGGKLSVKLRDPKARKRFSDRHNCPQKNDKCTPGYWSCRLPRYSKTLNLSGGGIWW